MKTKYPIGKVELLLGWVCNQNCLFCSVGHKLRKDRRIKSLEEVKKVIESAKEQNSPGVSFSGGEPTIIPYLFDAIRYAKKLDFEIIEVQSNGRMFANEEFTKKVVEAGANGFIISVHGHTPELENYLTYTKGAFKQQIQGLENLKEMLDKGKIEQLRASTVVCKPNYKFLPEIIEFLLKFDLTDYHISPTIIDGNVLTNREIVVPLSDMAPFFHKAIDKIWGTGHHVSVYSYPFCLMQGYEGVIAELGKRDTILVGPDFIASIQEHRHKDRIKMKSCQNCKYDKICVGIWKRYVKLFGFNEFKPISGKKIENKDLFFDSEKY